MTLDDLEKKLREAHPGEGVRIPYDLFDEIFPPSHRDDNSRVAAYQFAKQRGFKIDNRPDDQAVWMFRDTSRT